MLLTAIMMCLAALGGLVNYFALKSTNKNKLSGYGVGKAIVFGLAVGFLYAYTTKGGTGIGHWDAAWTAFVMGFGSESIIGKLVGMYGQRRANKSAEKKVADRRSGKPVAEDDDDAHGVDEIGEPETDTKPKTDPGEATVEKDEPEKEAKNDGRSPDDKNNA